MTKHESSIWYLFKECFNLHWVSRQAPGTLLEMKKYITVLLETINKRLEQFD